MSALVDLFDTEENAFSAIRLIRELTQTLSAQLHKSASATLLSDGLLDGLTLDTPHESTTYASTFFDPLYYASVVLAASSIVHDPDLSALITAAPGIRSAHTKPSAAAYNELENVLIYSTLFPDYFDNKMAWYSARWNPALSLIIIYRYTTEQKNALAYATRKQTKSSASVTDQGVSHGS